MISTNINVYIWASYVSKKRNCSEGIFVPKKVKQCIQNQDSRSTYLKDSMFIYLFTFSHILLFPEIVTALVAWKNLLLTNIIIALFEINWSVCFQQYPRPDLISKIWKFGTLERQEIKIETFNVLPGDMVAIYVMI